ncbi:hypothetical protein LJB42_004194 [Komagataella kurtzmanii]|nr:hypothetical protein LJB42_004194 [Komagataella kurtzmanii]
MPVPTDGTYANNFWGKNDHGSQIVIDQLNKSRKSCEELYSYYKEKIQLEEEYSRKLGSLSKKYLGSEEFGSLKDALHTLTLESRQIAASHLAEADQISTQVSGPLETFISSWNAKRKPVELNLEKICKYRSVVTQKLEHSKKKYLADCQKLQGYQSQKMLADGRELEKLEAKIPKLKVNLNHHRRQYYEYVKELTELNEMWIREWGLASVTLQQLEEERIKFIKSNIWTFANVISTTCLSDDSSAENVRVSLEKCESKQVIQEFVDLKATGSTIYSSPRFIEFYHNEQEEELKVLATSNINILNPMDTLPLSDSYSKRNIVNPSDPTLEDQNRATFEDRHNDNMKQYKTRPESLSLSGNVRLDPPSSPTLLSSSPPNTEFTTTESGIFSSSTTPTTYSKSSQKSWNSPTRRRSRLMYQRLEAQKNSKRSETPGVNSSHQYSHQFPQYDHSKQTKHLAENSQKGPPQLQEDLLKSYLEDLNLGGNGDMNKLRQSLGKSSNTSRPMSMHLDSHSIRSQTPLEKSPSYRRSKSATTLNQFIGVNRLPEISSSGHQVLKYSRALYSYRADVAGEVSFQKKDIMLVLNMQPDGWWMVELLRTGDVGLAPSNYLTDLQ